MTKRKRFFTLPEVVAVLVILGLLSAMALPALKGPSVFSRMEKAALEFEAFCGRVRHQAVESGKDRCVIFDPEKKEFYLLDPDGPDEAVSSIHWKLPEGLEYSDEQSEIFDEKPEIFRFYPDGGASGKRELVMRCGTVRWKFHVSLLTGFLTSQQMTGKEDE